MRAPCLALAALLALPAAPRAQEPKTDDAKKAASRDDAPAPRFATREALDAHYQKAFAELDRQRIKDLGALAPTLKGPESEATYAELLNLAVTRDQYEAAEKPAEAFLQSGQGSPQTRALASFVNIIAASNRGQYDQAVADLDDFLKAAASGDPKAPTLDPSLMFAVGEAFLQRLIRDREYTVARKVCRTFLDGAADATVKEHFAARLARIDMLGKPAPGIAGIDIDGQKVSLDDFKGKVVLVDFWATWCQPCAAQMPYYSALQQKYGEKGFQVLGVNVDSANQNVKDRTHTATAVRRFLVAMRVAWPSVMNGPGAHDFAKAYGVTDIPANFLINRDGKILQVELSDQDLDRAIAEALGIKEDEKDAKK